MECRKTKKKEIDKSKPEDKNNDQEQPPPPLNASEKELRGKEHTSKRFQRQQPTRAPRQGDRSTHKSPEPIWAPLLLSKQTSLVHAGAPQRLCGAQQNTHEFCHALTCRFVLKQAGYACRALRITTKTGWSAKLASQAASRCSTYDFMSQLSQCLALQIADFLEAFPTAGAMTSESCIGK